MDLQQRIAEKAAKLGVKPRIMRPPLMPMPPPPATPPPVVQEPKIQPAPVPEPVAPDPYPGYIVPKQPDPVLEGEPDQESVGPEFAGEDEEDKGPIQATTKHKVIEKGTVLVNQIEGLNKNSDDYHTLEWGRERNAGFVVGRVMSSVPMFFTADAHTVKLEDAARGGTLLIVGPAAKALVKGAFTWAVDAISKDIKPDFWTSAADPNLTSSIWADPTIVKVVPTQFSYIKRPNGQQIAHCPFAFYFRRHSKFSPLNYLFEDTVFCPAGNEIGHSLIVTVRLAYILGFRKVYISGAPVGPKVEEMLGLLRGHFDKYKYKVYDTSGLIKTLPQAELSSAVF